MNNSIRNNNQEFRDGQAYLNYGSLIDTASVDDPEDYNYFIEHYYKHVGSNRRYLSLRIRGEAGAEDELISEFNRRHNKSGQDEMQIDEIKAAIYKQQQKIVYEANKVIESVQMRASNAERLLESFISMISERLISFAA